VNLRIFIIIMDTATTVATTVATTTTITSPTTTLPCGCVFDNKSHCCKSVCPNPSTCSLIKQQTIKIIIQEDLQTVEDKRSKGFNGDHLPDDVKTESIADGTKPADVHDLANGSGADIEMGVMTRYSDPITHNDALYLHVDNRIQTMEGKFVKEKKKHSCIVILAELTCLLCFYGFIFGLLAILNVIEVHMYYKYVDNSTCSYDDHLLSPLYWLKVMGWVGIAQTIYLLIITTVVILLSAPNNWKQASFTVYCFYWPFHMFNIVWVIMGAVAFWRDNQYDCYPDELHNFIYASLIIHIVVLGSK
jgi:hypothetical protein